MSAPNKVLYDAPGPKTRARTRLFSIAAVVLLAAIVAYVLFRLADQDQLSYERWGALIDPTNDNFPLVWRLLGGGLLNTAKAASLTIVLAVVIGTLLAVGRLMLGKWGRIPLASAMELFRGLPVVLAIFFASRVLTDMGVDISPLPGEDGLWFVVLGLTAYNSVIIAEIIRSGVANLPRGQREAGMAIGLTPGQSMRLILLPQAFRQMLPALISQIVVAVKDTSLAAILGIYPELLLQARRISQTLDNPIQMLSVAALIYILINYSLSRFAIWLERWLSRGTSSKGDIEDAVEQQPVGAGA